MPWRARAGRPHERRGRLPGTSPLGRHMEGRPMSARQIEVAILGQTYTLSCPDGSFEHELLEAAARVDREMGRIRDTSKIKARDRQAVLAAIIVAHERIEAARQAPAAPEPAAAAVRPPAATPAGADPHEATMPRSAEIDALIRRIDTVLGGDGHLL